MTQIGGGWRERIFYWVVSFLCRVVVPGMFVVLVWNVCLELGFGVTLAMVGAFVVGGSIYGNGKKFSEQFRHWDIQESDQRLTVGQMVAFVVKFLGLYLLIPVVFLVADSLSRQYEFLVPSVVALVSAGVVYWAVHKVVDRPIPKPKGGDIEIERGRELISPKEATARATRLSTGDEEPIIWGGLPLPADARRQHFMVAGCTGSGKTVTLRIMMQSVLRRIRPGSNQRAIVYDAKGEMVSLLLGMGINCDVLTLHPVDTRGYAWDIAADIDDINLAKSVAAILVPEEKETQKYFPRAARRLLEGVLRVFIKSAPGKWTLQDVLLVLNDMGLLRRVLGKTAYTRQLIEKYFEPETTFKNTVSTLDTFASRYESIAACWAKAAAEGRCLSLKEWAKTSSILVIKRDSDIAEALDPINRVIFERLGQILLGHEAGRTVEGRPPLTWVFLDEVGKAGELAGLDDWLLKGRSKGLSLVLGFQDINSMWDTYGREKAEALLGQCGNNAFLRLDSQSTAEWASKLFGQYEAMESFQSHSWSEGTESTSVNQQRNRRDAVLPSEFFALEDPHERGLIDGYYLTRSVGGYRFQYPFVDRLRDPGPTRNCPRGFRTKISVGWGSRMTTTRPKKVGPSDRKGQTGTRWTRSRGSGGSHPSGFHRFRCRQLAHKDLGGDTRQVEDRLNTPQEASGTRLRLGGRAVCPHLWCIRCAFLWPAGRSLVHSLRDSRVEPSGSRGPGF